MTQIYLDHNASTPLDPGVVRKMESLLSTCFGNPSTSHWAGRPARLEVEEARAEVAALLGCSPEEIVFTSGGSEASNFAIKGTYYQWLKEGKGSDPHFITSAVEHPATLEPLRFLESLGARVTVLPVDHYGRIDPADVERALTPRTALVTLMHANNEVGTIQPIEEVSALLRPRSIPLHTDAAQTVGKIPTEVDALGVDMLTVAGHKFHAPKGVGALYLRRGRALVPLVHGAGHESGRRAGTENVLLIAGLGRACRVAKPLLGMPEVRALRDHLEAGLKKRLHERISINGHPQHRLPNTLSVNFHGRIGAEVLEKLEGVAASTGSACHSGLVRLSPVLEAMGVTEEAGMGAVRFSLGRGNSEAEIDRVLELVGTALR